MAQIDANLAIEKIDSGGPHIPVTVSIGRPKKLSLDLLPAWAIEYFRGNSMSPIILVGAGLLLLALGIGYFQVPYRAMLPKGVANLIVTGRSIGGDRDSHAAVRNMMCCTVSGQGAGVAAATSLQNGQAIEEVDIGTVQKELLRQDVRIQ